MEEGNDFAKKKKNPESFLLNIWSTCIFTVYKKVILIDSDNKNRVCGIIGVWEILTLQQLLRYKKVVYKLPAFLMHQKVVGE